jgi:hypothetical protein
MVTVGRGGRLISVPCIQMCECRTLFHRGVPRANSCRRQSAAAATTGKTCTRQLAAIVSRCLRRPSLAGPGARSTCTPCPPSRRPRCRPPRWGLALRPRPTIVAIAWTATPVSWQASLVLRRAQFTLFVIGSISVFFSFLFLCA